MKILVSLLLLLSFSSISSAPKNNTDVLGLLTFARTLKGHMDPKQQGLKLISEKEGQYYLTGKLEKIADEMHGIECDFKNKFFPSAKSQTLILDYAKTRTYHKVFKFTYNNLETLKSDFEQAAKVQKTKYKYSVRIQNQAFSEIRETETRISLKIKENITVIGYRVSRAKSLIDGVFFEISMELENKQLVVKSIDYRNVK